MIEPVCFLPSKALQHDLLIGTVVWAMILVLFIVWAIGWQIRDKNGDND